MLVDIVLWHLIQEIFGSWIIVEIRDCKGFPSKYKSGGSSSTCMFQLFVSPYILFEYVSGRTHKIYVRVYVFLV